VLTSGCGRRPLVQGLLSNLGNPKMAVFFTSLLPQFAPHGPSLRCSRSAPCSAR
jgi:threonine/homoserine/homoserine lactone efflux protein